MKRLFTLIALLSVMLGAAAQTENVYLWKNGVYTVHPLSSIDSITFAVPGNPNDKPNDAPNDVTVVDLGLPSGTLWADRNIGANSPEDYGDLFAWGETKTKEQYIWDNYKFRDSSNEKLTKYCTNSRYGVIDNKTTLEAEDDAATANWGNDWCMPTDEQLLELRRKCKWEWTTLNNVAGYNITGSNGISIFLPAASHHDIGGYTEKSSCYWSSTLQSSSSCAYEVWFNSEEVGDVVYCSRWIGLSVRAVRSVTR